MPILDPFLDPLFNAQLYLDTWVKAVTLQYQRLQERPRLRSTPDSRLSAKQISDWLLSHNADVLMLALALDQIADAAQAVHDAAPTETAKAALAAAIERFNLACPDRRGVRNAITHVRDYQRGKGNHGNGHSRSDYPFPDYHDALIIAVGTGNDDINLLEIDVGDGARAARELQRTIRSALKPESSRNPSRDTAPTPVNHVR